jgi:tetratricopeptide (TPR) repeat protein
MNNNTSSHFKQSIFWLYYAKGLLQTKLGQHTEAVQSFTACIDYTNYAKVLTSNYDIAQQELRSHRQALKALKASVSNKINSINGIEIQSGGDKLLQQYKQVIEFFIELINLRNQDQPRNIPDFAAMFEMPLTKNNSPNHELQCGYAHYNKALGHIKLKQQKEVLNSLNMSNKLLPDFSSAYITKANIYKDQKEYIKTIAQYDQAIRIDDNNAELYFGRATALFELGKANQAKDDFAKYKSLNSLQTTEIN